MFIKEIQELSSLITRVFCCNPFLYREMNLSVVITLAVQTWRMEIRMKNNGVHLDLNVSRMNESLRGSVSVSKTRLPPGELSAALKSTDIQ